MSIRYPSQDFDDIVAAICHGAADDAQCRSLNQLLRADAAALDAYILRVEIHARLLSDADLFVARAAEAPPLSQARGSGRPSPAPASGPLPASRRIWFWGAGIAALLVLAALGWWQTVTLEEPRNLDAVSRAVAMLDRSVRAQGGAAGAKPLSGDPLDPGWLRLEAGLAQVVFYKGSRMVVEGPAEFQMITPSHVKIRNGRMTVEIPAQSTAFRIDTPHATLGGLGGSVGLEVAKEETTAQVFEGEIQFQAARSDKARALTGGAGVIVSDSSTATPIASDPATFAALFAINAESSEALAARVSSWESAGKRLNGDPTLLTRLDFHQLEASRWKLKNLSQRGTAPDYAAIVGCQWGEGRWPGKRSLEFQNVNDRVRVDVDGEYGALTLAAWVRVQGLDRELNALFTSDGFDAGTIHWLIRDDGVLGLTVVGAGDWNYQIIASPPVVTLNRLGTWIHLAVTLDGESGQASHYLNGRAAHSEALAIKPPYRIGPAELGNWSARGFPKEDPFMIRNFSGAMDEFCLFGRALDAKEIQRLYDEGRPDLEQWVALRE